MAKNDEEGPLRTTEAIKTGRKMSKCDKDCVVELTFCGVDAGFYVFYLVHNRDGMNVQVPMGTNLTEAYKALGRSLTEMAGHGDNTDAA